ncbi:MAG: anti-sigma factor [Acidobacteriaceae bacterium]|nr:anti-sigma factor [Acidobacteriaceae bacterium]MBV9765454.1 anti-sigma factor [Acidobacteriaceae bacterium]
MSCDRIQDSLDAYLDRELDVLSARDFERHLNDCDACRVAFERYRDLQASVKTQLPYFQAPESLVRKIRTQLGSSERRGEPSTIAWRAWAVAASLVICLAFGTLLFRSALRPSSTELIADQVVSSHIRSLMANHLVDVPSSDQHTVKPWFNGKLDFAPPIRDLSPEGFPLIGGRLDYVDARAVAALVYKRRQHPINLFLWPASDVDSKPSALVIRGYHVIHGIQSHTAYWAISDLNADELKQFVQDFFYQSRERSDRSADYTTRTTVHSNFIAAKRGNAHNHGSQSPQMPVRPLIRESRLPLPAPCAA